MKELDMGRVYSLMSYDWESSQEWLFTHKKNISNEHFKVDVDFLIQKYKDEYFESKKGGYVTGYGLIHFISRKLPELGYDSIKPVCYSFDGDDILNLKDEIEQLQVDYQIERQIKRTKE
jgi:hypothetical protein